MIRMEPNAVLKYFEPIDAFVKIRLFTGAEAAALFRNTRISNRRAFVDLVVNACVVNYTESVLARLGSGASLPDRFALEDRLYELCVEANPSLDLKKIAIPVSEEPQAEIHLLEHAAPSRTRNLESLRSLEDELANRVIGQPQAVSAVARALKKSLTGLRDPERPIATFFFVGQTGVGKTELAKAITLSMTGDPSRMFRIDCSEYALPHEYAKLIGAPPGYIGHDQGGLFAGILSRGQTVVLFDEVEKSDAKVHDLLLQAMDEGFVTDGKGRRIPFGETVMVLTSNVGADEIEAFRNRMGFSGGKRELSREELFDETFTSLKTRFRPEFLNRLSEVVLFNSIGLAECVKIVRRLLEEVKRHAAGVPIRLDFSDSVPPLLAEKGFRPEFGARELRRTVEREVEGPLADLLVEGLVREGDRVSVRVSRDQLQFHRN
jgi:ATP-dependent Clp protease ATP-binding subunit ClpC